QQAAGPRDLHEPRGAARRLRGDRTAGPRVRPAGRDRALRGLRRRVGRAAPGRPRGLRVRGRRIGEAGARAGAVAVSLGAIVSLLRRTGPALGVALAFVVVWDVLVRLSGSELFPKPLEVAAGIVE